MMYTKPITPDELYHHGIKGQKWGIRRFQNKDGSLTSAGRKQMVKQEAKRLTKELNKYDSQMGSAVLLATNEQRNLKSYYDQAERLTKKADNIKARNQKQYDKKLAKYEAKAQELIKNRNIVLSKIDRAGKDYTQGKQMIEKLIKELEGNKDLVYSVNHAERYADTSYTKGINKELGKNKGGWYYQSSTGNKYKVKVATDRRRKKEKYQKHKTRSHGVVRREYYYMY